MAFTPDFLDELRLRIGLADLIGKRVRLSRKGNEFQGLCPFHKEKTPSFTLNEEKGFYHCFGCGAHGSAIDFVMNMDGLSFPEAVEQLAQDVGLEVPVDNPQVRERNKVRESLYKVTDAACNFFEKKLFEPEGKVALDYLKKRGIDEVTISKFRIGFAPNGRGELKAALLQKNINDQQLLAAGLLVQTNDKDRENFDRFRNRVIFPIADKRGRVIAFGGRIIDEQTEKKVAKYLNSPETELFQKGKVLFNLAQATKIARNQGTVIVTEGYMDVIALFQAGFENVVAPLGTALTSDQINELWKLVREPVLCFDGDSAGRRAQARAAERALTALKPGYTLRFATLPYGEDPDSLIQSGGAEKISELISRSEPLSEILWLLETDGRLLNTPEQRASVQKALEDHARSINDSTVRAHFLKNFRDRLWETTRFRRGLTGKKQVKRVLDISVASSAKIDARTLQEQILIATLLGHPTLFDLVGEQLGTVSFSATGLDNLRQEVLKTLAREPRLDSDGIRRHLCNEGYSEILNKILSPKFFLNAYFAKPEVDIEFAQEGWEEVYALYKNAELEDEIKQESQRLIEDTSSENLNRFNTLSEQKMDASRGVEENKILGVHGSTGKQ